MPCHKAYRAEYWSQRFLTDQNCFGIMKRQARRHCQKADGDADEIRDMPQEPAGGLL